MGNPDTIGACQMQWGEFQKQGLSLFAVIRQVR